VRVAHLNSRRLIKHCVALICALVICPAFAADVLIVKGELSFDSGGLAQVAECGSDRVFILGVMASNPYISLLQRYNETSDAGRFAVLVEVKGLLARHRSSNGALVLDSPDIATLVRGSCANATPNNSPERTLDVTSSNRDVRSAQHNR
jgi:hypothetical protein